MVLNTVALSKSINLGEGLNLASVATSPSTNLIFSGCCRKILLTSLFPSKFNTVLKVASSASASATNIYFETGIAVGTVKLSLSKTVSVLAKNVEASPK